MRHKLFASIVVSILLLMQFGFAQCRLQWENPRSDTRYENTQITCSLGDYTTSSIFINGKEYRAIHLAGSGYSAEKGFPDLPSVNKAIIIPDNQKMRVEVIRTEYRDIPMAPIAPSRGTIYRNQDPTTIPYTFDELYQQDTWYPNNTVKLNSPFIQRDFRGCLIQVYPFQYNPAKNMLRVYTKITFAVIADGESQENVFERTRAIEGIDGEFNEIYSNRFLNYDQTRYPVVAEDGNMLIIAHSSYMNALAPFVQWKKKKGLKVELVDVATAGTSASALQTYIKNYYNSDANKLKYVLLVGDADKVPTLLVQSKYGADIKFGQIVGSDVYADIFVGRFSAASENDVKTQVDKSIFYETSMKTSDTWLSNVLLSASSDKQKNKWGETDADFVNHEYDSLKKAGYTNVARHNQSGVGGTGCTNGTAASCTEVINKGISFWEYSDHGTKTSYPAVKFTTSSASALSNSKKYFYTYSVACNPGEFNTSGDCFGEALMKKVDGGTIGTYMGSISQPWDPPYAALREILFINLDRAPHTKVTLGGLMLNGGMTAQEKCPGTEGKDTYESFVLLGDPNLQVYSKTPSAITIKHPSSINTGTQSVTITGTDGAQVCLYSEKQNIQIVGVIQNGTLTLSVDVKSMESIFITAMKRNHETYRAEINGATGIIPSGNAGAEFTVSSLNRQVYYTLPSHLFASGNCRVALKVYDVMGSVVYSTEQARPVAGSYSIAVDNENQRIAQGIYVGKLQANALSKTFKIIVK
ncbi:MAG: hypothetical protein JW795_03590 [Chitinivibrionales bacterium]|nr:hypothetical protein [Chitinivibrionales bacterium]